MPLSFLSFNPFFIRASVYCQISRFHHIKPYSHAPESDKQSQVLYRQHYHNRPPIPQFRSFHAYRLLIYPYWSTPRRLAALRTGQIPTAFHDALDLQLRQSQCQGIKPPMRHCTVKVAFGKLFSYLPLPLQAYPQWLLAEQGCSLSVLALEYPQDRVHDPVTTESKTKPFKISYASWSFLQCFWRSYLAADADRHRSGLAEVTFSILEQPLAGSSAKRWALFALPRDAKPRTGVNALDTG